MPSVDHPPSAEPSGKAYGRSLDELADTPQFREFLHREFPAGAAERIMALSRELHELNAQIESSFHELEEKSSELEEKRREIQS